MKQLYKKYKQLIPLLILTGLSLNVIDALMRGTVTLAGETYPFVLSFSHLGAFAAIISCWVIFYRFRSIFKFAISLTLILGIANLINFKPLETVTTINIGNLGVGFQPLVLLFGLVSYALNFRAANNLLFGWLRLTPEEAYMAAQQGEAEEIEKFMERYADYSDESLQNILLENRYVPTALEAARRTLNERSGRC